MFSPPFFLGCPCRRHLSEVAYLLLAAAALIAAVWLRFEFRPERERWTMLWVLVPFVLAAKLIVFRIFSLRDLSWKYLSFDDLLRLAAANFAASLCVAAVGYWRWQGAFPRSIYVLDWLLSLALMALTRAASRLWFDGKGSSVAHSRRILIYGAGKAGRIVLSDIRAHRELAVQVVGFLDDDPAKRHLRLSGLRVVGRRDALAAVVKKLGVDEVWLALPGASGVEIANILEQCHLASVATNRIPPLAELIEEKRLLAQIREVRIEDLLGRPPVTLSPGQCNQFPRHTGGQATASVVLVTGAGGSIGSELCRQIARSRPLALVGLDHSEAALYQIDQEIRQSFPEVAFYAEIGNIQNLRRLQELFAGYRPDTVYHAAAYKHVPLMEAQMFEALENNVFGTEQLAEVARANRVQRFVLISSDKAVAPTNVMGATKRLAEMVCLQGRQGAESARSPTRFLAVRFGNVLGSSGSVIPLFRRQIAAGGPVTITHPDMRRYFMTIPEAVELVLQAASLGTGGEIFVLDMGEPVKILDLARKMILLSGLRPEQDVMISVTGVRPGEKLFEELHTPEEETEATPHPKIRVYRTRVTCAAATSDISRTAGEINAAGSNLVAGRGTTPGIRERLESLHACVKERDLAATVILLKDMIPDYSPSAPILRSALSATASPGLPNRFEPRYRKAASA
jgi:FlaA1/EpsC-like NDP-sugar epimerase